ncbi:hypothetical protein BJ322DRAFT_1104878 [Thelephora terrestris]|uniref:Cytidyltransferase-like domain-containing protein n=1 Tax=Thelephora terrestris TaxID=56493 RepID=A0A9P6HQ14_9AGAM|nr:hypothetical protein BJ322DRAFT_1104878 [Thelephora terrestris]
MPPVTPSTHELETPEANVYSTSILLANLSSPSDYHVLESAIRNATRSTSDRLVIILYSSAFVDDQDPRAKWFEIQRLLTWTYVEGTAVAQDMGKVLMDIDVLLRPPSAPAVEKNADDEELVKKADALYVFRDESDTFLWWVSRTSNPVFISKPASWSAPHISLPPPPDANAVLLVVALGGTFDHLHAGHKILLSMAVWLSRRKVIVGVTDENLLVNKANKHVLESLTHRIDRVRSFLTSFKPSLEYEIVPIHDVYGPPDPEIQALVVSKETLSGAAAIDRKRKELGFPPLETFVIDVISANHVALDSDDPELLKKTKLSSTFIREWIVDRQRHEEFRVDSQSRPA